MENNELYGTLVLVHPDLKNDPAGQQGKVGILSYIDSRDEIYVGFENGREGKYSPDALMSLKDKSEIFPDLMANGSKLDLSEYKDLYKISLLQDRGRSTDIVHALEIAAKNPAIWDKSLVAVDQLLAPRMAQSVGR